MDHFVWHQVGWDNAHKLDQMGVLLEGPAFNFFCIRKTQHITYAEMVQAFQEQYQVVNKQLQARDALAMLQQGNMLAQEYAEQFRCLIMQIPRIQEDETKHHFIHGLDPILAWEIQAKDYENM